VRYLYQGILQLGVGFYHWRRGNWHGAVTKLRQGMEKLDPYRPACMTVDVERLVRETAPLLAELQRRGRDDLAPFGEASLPTVHRLAAS
jgi:hypothetical protein